MKKRLYTLMVLPLFLLMFCVALTHMSYAQQTKEVILGGYNFEPTVRTSGSGMVTVRFENDSLTVSGDFSHLTDTYQGAYIMVGEKGESLNMLFRLNATLNKEKTGGTFDGSENTFALNEAQQKLLKSGEFYITITSQKHTDGELRGQIPPIKP